MQETINVPSTRYAFLQHTRRMRRVAIPAALVLVVSGLFILLAFLNLLPPGLGCVVALAFLLAVLCIVLLIPLLVFFYGYSKGGFWLEEQGCACIFLASRSKR